MAKFYCCGCLVTNQIDDHWSVIRGINETKTIVKGFLHHQVL